MEYSIKQSDDGTQDVALIGVLNEDAELALHALSGELANKPTVNFNFSKVKSINSLGVRAWVTFLRGIEEGRQVSFSECTPDVIMQINMVPSFKSRSSIKSFYTNYVCENCDRTDRVTIETSTLAPKTIPPAQKCTSCGSLMETEELEDEYFAFLLR